MPDWPHGRQLSSNRAFWSPISLDFESLLGSWRHYSRALNKWWGAMNGFASAQVTNSRLAFFAMPR